MRTVNFGDWNSWDDGELLTLSILVPPPVPNYVFIEVAGRDGALDMSEAVAGRITYKQSELEFAFRYVGDDSKTKIKSIIDLLHGKKKTVSVSDDTDEYEGRCTVKVEEDKGYYMDLTITVYAEKIPLGV